MTPARRQEVSRHDPEDTISQYISSRIRRSERPNADKTSTYYCFKL